ncbi:MAG: response regulator [Elusimicrobia bacterium]|nr:response regulator [Elusimicrobiota bacterium]
MAESRPLRILLIDNEPNTQELLKRDLESLGHAVTLAEDGASGVEFAKMDPAPELLVLDLMMDPKGTELVLEEIALDPRTANVPAVVLSVQRYATLRRRVGEKPRITLYKPFRLPELQNAVAQALALAPKA